MFSEDTKNNRRAETVDILSQPMSNQELVLPSEGLGNLPSNTPIAQLNSSSLLDVVQSYIKYYATGEGHTARAKRYDLKYFLDYLASPNRRLEDVQVGDWTLQATKDYVDSRLSMNEAPATVSRRLATIKHFGRTLAERIPGFINPAREVKSPVLQPTKPHGLSVDEISLLRQVAAEIEAEKSTFIAARNRFLLELLLATGLRADEVRLLVVSQVSPEVDWLRNVKTKGRKFRNVYLDQDIRTVFDTYLRQRDEELQKKFPEVFSLTSAERGKYPVLISLYGAQLGSSLTFGMAPKSIWRVIADFGKRARAIAEGPVGSLHPHKLRHTFAHGLLDSSKDVRLVAQALGHSDVRTTMRYTERTEEEVAAAIEQKRSDENSS